MLCCSPDFTNPDANARSRAVEHQAEMIRVTRRLGGPGAVCRVLSGQRYPEVSRRQGLAWVIACIEQVLPVAREHDIVLGLENHYKDGFWKYPEFAQKQEVFLELLARFPNGRISVCSTIRRTRWWRATTRWTCSASVADRVVSMHASDRYLAEGATLEELRAKRRHARLLAQSASRRDRRGLNDYHAIFRILAEHGYGGWISIEDGMNGMEEMAESLAFLRRMARSTSHDSV